MDGYNQLLPAPQIKTIPKRTWKLSKKTYTWDGSIATNPNKNNYATNPNKFHRFQKMGYIEEKYPQGYNN